MARLVQSIEVCLVRRSRRARCREQRNLLERSGADVARHGRSSGVAELRLALLGDGYSSHRAAQTSFRDVQVENVAQRAVDGDNDPLLAPAW